MTYNYEVTSFTSALFVALHFMKLRVWTRSLDHTSLQEVLDIRFAPPRGMLGPRCSDVVITGLPSVAVLVAVWPLEEVISTPVYLIKYAWRSILSVSARRRFLRACTKRIAGLLSV